MFGSDFKLFERTHFDPAVNAFRCREINIDTLLSPITGRVLVAGDTPPQANDLIVIEFTTDGIRARRPREGERANAIVTSTEGIWVNAQMLRPTENNPTIS